VLAYILRIGDISYSFGSGPEGQMENISMNTQPYVSQLYMIVITMTTVGYGDIVPLTDVGRVAVCFVALFGAFMVGLFVLIVSKFFELGKS